MTHADLIGPQPWRAGVGGAIASCIVASALAHADPINVVAAESVYGDIAAQIGGPRVAVKSILSNPNQDPHQFEASASTARSIAEAKLVIYNGADYDPWAERLLSASGSSPRETIEVAALIGKKAGANPHLWYEPAAVSALAAAVAARLTKLDPEQGADYARGLALFDAAMERLAERIGALRVRHAGTAVTATEPVFEYMADALGLTMRNRAFQLAVMNGTEPSATAIAAFENDLRTHAVKALLYNSQTTAALARRMRTLANAAGVPVIAITETEPAGLRYPEWMLVQLDALDRALSSR